MGSKKLKVILSFRPSNCKLEALTPLLKASHIYRKEAVSFSALPPRHPSITTTTTTHSSSGC